jgi:predicted DNA-binding transcriptional regulator YafY
MRTSGLFQVKRWILSFGPDAKVLAPEKLLSAVSDELNAASSLYLNQNK